MSLISKLQNMSVSEISFRCRGLFYEQVEKIVWYAEAGKLYPYKTDAAFFQKITVGEKSVDGLLNYMRKRQGVAFFVDEHKKQSMLETIHKQYPQLIQQSTEQADKICRHEFSFLGIEVSYKDEISWTKDPVSLKEWPMKFYADVNIYGRDIGDVKHVWELNRHQFFVDIGKAYWLSGDERYAKEFFTLITSWIDDNPYKTGINWASALEVAVRSTSWLWAYHFCLRSSLLTPETNLKILKSIYQHADYLKNHLSFFSSPYNHLIGELSALFMIATIFPEFKEAKVWRKKSWNMLDGEIGKQFYQDGGIVEQATFYQHFTLGFYLMATLLREMNGCQVSDRVWLGVEKAIEFSMYMIRPDGLIPMMGDIDNARSIYVENPPMWDFRAFLSTGAVLFNRGDMKKIAQGSLSGRENISGKGFSEDSLWLLGIDGLKKYQGIADVYPENGSRAFEKSGYYIMRSDWSKDSNYLCFDCGEIASGLFKDSTPSAAHGHADLLSFELSAFGHPMIIDPGFYTYNGDERLHYYFRQTRAHNTITIDGQSQAKEAGKMSWSNVPEYKLEKWITNKEFDLAIGSHNGYKPVIHKRAVLFKKEGAFLAEKAAAKVAIETNLPEVLSSCGCPFEIVPLTPEYWVIHDSLEGHGEHLVEGYFHFVPGVKLEEVTSLTAGTPRSIVGKTIVARHPEGVGIVIQPAASMLLDVDIIDTGDIPDGGWIAPGYGSLVRASILRYQGMVKLPCEITTVIYPFNGNVPPNIDPSLIDKDIWRLLR
ncbi:MAG: alginate lyase family protein [bacterium]